MSAGRPPGGYRSEREKARRDRGAPTNFTLRLPQDLGRRIDALRGKHSRGAWIVGACEERAGREETELAALRSIEEQG